MKWLTFVALSINLAPFFSSTCIAASSVGATTNLGTEESSTPSASVSATPTTTPTNSSVPTSSSASGSSAPAPTSTGVPDSDTLKDIQTIFERRLSSITGALTKAKDVASWLTTLGDDGKWPDSEVDYTTGCEARRANWPAQTHWQRISTMAGAWHGGLKGAESQYVKDPTLRADIAKAMQYWFSRDFVNNPACLDLGGEDACPCSNPENTLWNTNWFSNIILIPGFVGETCVLLNGTLSNSELEGCVRMTSRAYGTFGREINGLGTLTGANTLDVASIGIDLALITLNQTLIADAHSKVHAELVIEDAVHADGIRRDGAFGQHAGILYNGNYGKDYSNDILAIEIDAAGTQFQASDVSKSAFNTLFEGNSWMIYQNILTGVNHWDFSALGRFISFPVADNQATGSLKTNLTQVQELGKLWSSDILDNYATSLSKNWTSANAGNLQGNRMFYTNDYMVHRGPNYVTTVKMYSSRSQNTECVNNQNPFGFHLADGAVHTYIKGNEYEDIAAAWDWNLIPGTTTDYGATPLECNTTSQTGVESFVGGASDGKIGLAAMKFTNPITQFHFQKVWFFLEDDTHHVLISNVSPTLKTPVYSVLDQRLATGEVFVNGQTQNTASHARVKTLWHGDIGYTFPDFGTTVSAQVASKSGNWTAIGTSTRPPITVNLFSAYIEHNPFIRNVGYTVFPGSDQATFASKTNNLQLRTVRNDEHVAAVYDSKHKTAMAVFWDVKGGSATFIAGFGSHQAFTISADANVAVIYKPEDASLTVSDPSQTLNSVTIQVEAGWGYQMPGWGGSERGKVVTVQLPQGGLAGNSVTRSLRSRKGYHHKRRLAFH